MDFENNICLLGRSGTGKSEAILYRIINLVKNRICSEKEILIIVSKNINVIRFRNKLGKLGLKSNNISIFTVEEFCLNLVRRMFSEDIGLKFTFTYINEKQQTEIIREILNNEYKDLIKEKFKKAYKIKETIDSVKLEYIFNQNYNFEIFKDEIGIDFGIEFFEKYNRYLDKNNLVDYMDILRYTNILLENDNIKNMYTKKYKYINIHKISEIQPYEYKIISRILNNNIMIVFDKLYEGNEIYKLLNKDFNFKVLEFSNNHRVTKSLVEIENEFANSMWENQGYIEAYLNKVGDKPCMINTKNIKSEAEFLVNDILESKLKGKESDCSILVKDSFYGEQLKIYLDKYSKGSLLFSLMEEINFLEDKTIEAMISYLNLIIDKHSDYHLKKVINEFYTEAMESLECIENNNLGVNLTDFIDGSTIKYKDPFGRLFRYMNAEDAVIFDVEVEINNISGVLIKLYAIKIDGDIRIIDEIYKELYVDEFSSINELIANGKEFFDFISGNLLIGNNVLGKLNYIDKLNEFLGVGTLNHKSYYDIFEIIKRYYIMDSYKLRDIIKFFNLKMENRSIYNIRNILIYLVNKNISIDTYDRRNLIEKNINNFYKIKKDLLSIRKLAEKRYVSPIDFLDKIIYVTGNKRIHFFDWGSGYEYKKYLKDFFLYFDDKNYNIVEKTLFILDKISVLKKSSWEFILDKNNIPILTLDECETFHFNNVYICGVNEENYSLEDKMGFYKAITRAKIKLKFVRPIYNIYGDFKGESKLIKNIKNKLDFYRY